MGRNPKRLPSAGAAAAGSEQISLRWVEGAERICIKCGVEITNLKKQIGEVRSRYAGRKEVVREIICMHCHLERSERLIVRARSQALFPPTGS